jgi:alkylation response protein AidB-like acyl-CoA dehydrogenase
MNFAPTPEQEQIRETARAFAAREVAPRAKGIDERAEFDWDLHRKLGDLGFLCMTAPEAYGGAASDTVTWCIVVEEIAKASSAVANGMTLTESMAHYVSTLGTEAQRRDVLPALAAGREICAFGLTEPGAGSDAKAVATTAMHDGDGDDWILDGQKMFISGALLAEWFIVVATLDKSLGARGVRTFLVRKGTPGLSCGGKLDLMGIRGFGTAPVFLDRCRIPASAMLGAGDDGFAQVMRGLDGAGRLGAAAMAVGLAQAAMDASLAYARERVQFGRPIADFQAVQFMLADMSAEIDAARLLMHKAAWRRDHGLPFTRESSHAKLFAGDMCMRNVTNAMQIFGGYAYSKEYPVERHFRDAKIHQIWDGTNQIQRIIIARQLLRES